MSATVDALVAGGGPAGAAAALTLARAGRHVVLAERGAADGRFKVGEALPGAARPLLRDLGVWDAFTRDGHLPCYGNRAVWGAATPVETDFIGDPNGHGWHVDRARFEQLLRRAALEAGAELREDAVRRPPAARMLIDATGRPATLARRLGGRRHRADRLVAVYATLRAPERDARTLIEAVPGGWWYAALVPGARRVVAFLTDADLLPRALRERDGFLAALAQTAHIAGGALERGPFTAPAHGSWLEPVGGDGWLAAGDAAVAFDPLSSQGLLSALYTGLTAGRAADAALAGDTEAVAAYRERLTEIRTAYVRNRADAYRREDRWGDHPFWARRA